MRLAVVGLVAAGVAGIAAIASQVPAQAASSPLDPSSLPRGADPSVPYLRHDTIHDGPLRVHATAGEHSQLWRIARGYLVLDGSRRLVWVGRTGERQLLGRSVYTVAVSPSRDRVVWGASPRGDFEPPVRFTVADVQTGSLVARRTFARVLWASAITRHRVLLTTSAATPEPATTWWRIGRPELSRLAGEAALATDVRAGRVVFAAGAADEFCNRVAALSRPRHTLSRSCRFASHAWSPGARQALATRTYYDDAGTDYWSVVDSSTATRTSQVTGWLGWDPAWEDPRHFLVPAMGADGAAAVVRCGLRAHCERASRVWDAGSARRPPYYVGPPVLLPSN